MTKNDTSPVSAWDFPLAVLLLTRLPMPRLPDKVFARQTRAVWAFPLVGLVLAALACAVGALMLRLGLSPVLAAGLVLALQIAASGAMHEDGLADTFDGLWGAHTRERRLEIMKDSQIGTYGVLALTLSLGLRWAALTALITAGALWWLIAAATWSRALMPVVMAGLPNARGAGLSHDVGRPSPAPVVIGLAVAAILSLSIAGGAALLPALLASLAVLVLAAIAKTKIGGQTGDILGASQQLAEIAFLLTLSATL